jgi:hypothetical protein
LLGGGAAGGSGRFLSGCGRTRFQSEGVLADFDVAAFTIGTGRWALPEGTAGGVGGAIGSIRGGRCTGMTPDSKQTIRYTT